jgi:hypothetical protein
VSIFGEAKDTIKRAEKGENGAKNEKNGAKLHFFEKK